MNVKTFSIISFVLGLSLGAGGLWVWREQQEPPVQPQSAIQSINAQQKKIQRELRIATKKTDFALEKLDQINLTHLENLEKLDGSKIAEQLEALTARIESLPDPDQLLEYGNDDLQAQTTTSKLDTAQWQAVMDKYESETGISRAEAEAILRQSQQ